MQKWLLLWNCVHLHSLSNLACPLASRCSPVLRAHLVGRGVVELQRVAVVVQHPHGLLSLQTEAAHHGDDGGRRLVGIQPLNGVKTDGINDQHTRTVGEPQLRKHKQKVNVVQAANVHYCLNWTLQMVYMNHLNVTIRPICCPLILIADNSRSHFIKVVSCSLVEFEWSLLVSVYVDDDSMISSSPGSRRWPEPWSWWGRASAWGPSLLGQTLSCWWCVNTGRSPRPQAGLPTACTRPPGRQTCTQTLGPNTGGVREGEHRTAGGQILATAGHFLQCPYFEASCHSVAPIRLWLKKEHKHKM